MSNDVEDREIDNLMSNLVSLGQLILKDRESGLKALQTNPEIPRELKEQIAVAFGDRDNEGAINLLMNCKDEGSQMAGGIFNWTNKQMKRRRAREGLVDRGKIEEVEKCLEIIHEAAKDIKNGFRDGNIVAIEISEQAEKAKKICKDIGIEECPNI